MFRFSTNDGVKTVWNRHFTNISVEIWVQSSNVYGFLGLSSYLRGICVNNAEVFDWGQGWWKSVQCLSMADVFNLECSLTLSPRNLEVSPMYEELQLSAWHSQWYTTSFFWLVGTLSLGCIRRGCSLNNYMVQLWVLLVLQWWPISIWSISKTWP